MTYKPMCCANNCTNEAEFVNKDTSQVFCRGCVQRINEQQYGGATDFAYLYEAEQQLKKALKVANGFKDADGEGAATMLRDALKSYFKAKGRSDIAEAFHSIRYY